MKHLRHQCWQILANKYGNYKHAQFNYCRRRIPEGGRGGGGRVFKTNVHMTMPLQKPPIAKNSIDPIRVYVRVRTRNTSSGEQCWGFRGEQPPVEGYILPWPLPPMDATMWQQWTHLVRLIDWLIDWLGFNGTASTNRLYCAFESMLPLKKWYYSEKVDNVTYIQ